MEWVFAVGFMLMYLRSFSAYLLARLFEQRNGTVVSVSTPRFDFLVFFAAAFSPLVFFFLYFNIGVPLASVLLLFIVVLDAPHVMQTLTRVLLDSHGRQQFARKMFWAFCGVALVCAALIMTGLGFFVLVVLVFYGPYHIIMQHFGIACLYRQRAPFPTAGSIRHDKHLLLSIYAMSLSWACQDLFSLGPLWSWDQFVKPFREAELLFVPPMIAQVWQWVVLPGAFLYVMVACFMWCRQFCRDLQQGRVINKPHLFTLALATINYGVVFFVLNAVATSMNEGLFLVAVGLTAWHALQYHGLVWHYNRQKFFVLACPEHGSRLLAWLAKKPTAWYYFMFILLLSVCAQLFVMLLLWFDQYVIKAWLGHSQGLALLAYSVTFTHYYLDGLIWKRRFNTELHKVWSAL